MSDNTTIEWADATWSPLIGCTRVSPGCDHCYAIGTSRIRSANPNPKVAAAFAGTVERTDERVDWTGKVNLLPDRLDQPLHWRKPRKVFVNSMSDLFHDAVPDEFIARVFAVMAAAPQHTFQLLTKRHARMRSLLNDAAFWEKAVTDAATALAEDGWPVPDWFTWPLENVWLGVSVENQQWADIRIPALLDTPAAVRFLSCEPLLGPVGVAPYLTRLDDCDTCEGTGSVDVPGGGMQCPDCGFDAREGRLKGVDWVIAGGESGPGARAMHPDWARSLRDQCLASDVPFLFKQWGEWGPAEWKPERYFNETRDAYKERANTVGATHAITNQLPDGSYDLYEAPHRPWSTERVGDAAPYGAIRRWGKKAAGRELDGRTHDQYPQAVSHGSR